MYVAVIELYGIKVVEGVNFNL